MCDKSFTQKVDLAKHIGAVHYKLKPFSCTLCDKSFSRKDPLTRHIDAVHRKLKPFSCTLCNKSFCRNELLTQHVDAVHYKQKDYSCSFCNKLFINKGAMNRHSTVYCRQNPYKLKRKAKPQSSQGDNIEIEIQFPSLDGNEIKTEFPFYQMDNNPEIKTELESPSFKDDNDNMLSSPSQQSMNVEIKEELQDQDDFKTNMESSSCKKGNYEEIEVEFSSKHEGISLEFPSQDYDCGEMKPESQFTQDDDVYFKRQFQFKNGDFKCMLCSQSFPMQTDLETHYKSHQIINVKCVKCGENVKMSHIEVHKCVKNYSSAGIENKTHVKNGSTPWQHGTAVIKEELPFQDDYCGIKMEFTPDQDDEIKRDFFHLDGNGENIIKASPQHDKVETLAQHDKADASPQENKDVEILSKFSSQMDNSSEIILGILSEKDD